MKDCCESKDKSGKMVDLKNVILWAIIGVLALAVIYVLFLQGSGTSVSSAGAQAARTASAMVGGC